MFSGQVCASDKMWIRQCNCSQPEHPTAFSVATLGGRISSVISTWTVRVQVGYARAIHTCALAFYC